MLASTQKIVLLGKNELAELAEFSVLLFIGSDYFQRWIAIQLPALLAMFS
jgi:hypothetical protein